MKHKNGYKPNKNDEPLGAPPNRGTGVQPGCVWITKEEVERAGFNVDPVGPEFVVPEAKARRFLGGIPHREKGGLRDLRLEDEIAGYKPPFFSCPPPPLPEVMERNRREAREERAKSSLRLALRGLAELATAEQLAQCCASLAGQIALDKTAAEPTKEAEEFLGDMAARAVDCENRKE